MSLVQVFEKTITRCNSGGCGCGGDVNQQLLDFARDADWATKSGAQIERFDLAQQLPPFANDQTVKDFIKRCGEEMLPLILVDGEIALASRYPNRLELANWSGVTESIAAIKPADGGCCSGGKCGG